MAAARVMLSSFRGCALESIRVADYGPQDIACGPLPRQGRWGDRACSKSCIWMNVRRARWSPDGGEQIKLINSGLGTEKVDVHLNRLVAGGPRGKRHHHTKADNIYIVKRGEGTLTVARETHVIRENDVVSIPAGMIHSLANLSASVFEIFEIYAPAGRQFDFVVDE